MKIQKNLTLSSKAGKDFLLDAYYEESAILQPVIVFAHGFKGFKDWGHWELIAKTFVSQGFVFIKFNFSHNGTTLARPLEFGDLEAFGKNNYSKELADLDAVIDWLFDEKCSIPAKVMDRSAINLIGHSRGGGISLIKAAADQRIKALITWAAVSRLDYAWQDNGLLDTWADTGVHYIVNGRTKQKMPLYYQLYEDFEANKSKLDTEKAAQQLEKPFLIVHGSEDPAVPIFMAEALASWNKSAQLHIIEGANHVFGGKHPYESKDLSAEASALVDICTQFMKTPKKG